MKKISKKQKKRRKKKILKARKRSAVQSGGELAKHAMVRLSTYKITGEPIEDPTIPDEIEDEMPGLFEKSQDAPALIVQRLEELIDKYPNVPVLYNFISVAYSRLNDYQKARQYIEKNYRTNPDYLFARLNWAEICMNEGRLEEVPKILNDRFDLKDMYPDRDLFHITEVVGFMGIVGLYYAHMGNEEQVRLYHKSLKKLDPDHMATKCLESYIADGFLG